MSLFQQTALIEREQFRKLQIELVPESGNYTDISMHLAQDEVTIEDLAFGIDAMYFVIANADSDWLIETLQKGMKVRYKGGYLKGNQEWLFDGYVADWTPLFSDSGQVSIKVTAYDKLWLLTRKKPGIVTYPVYGFEASLYDRDFNHTEQLTLSEIVKKIIEEYEDIKLGSFNIPKERDFIFTQLNPIVQNEDESDYDFITRLLRGKVYSSESRFDNGFGENSRYGHSVFFMETSGSGDAPETVLHVIPEEDLLEEDNVCKTVFVYNLQGSDIKLATAENYNPGVEDVRMPIHSVEVNTDGNAEGDKLIVKEASSGPAKKKKKVKGSAVKVGAPAEVEKTAEEGSGGPETSPPGGWDAWELDERAVRAAEENGELKGVDIATIVGKWPWSRVKKYFVPRETVFEPSSKQINATVEGDSKYEDASPEAAVKATPGGKNARGHSKKKTAEGGRRGKTIEIKDPSPVQWGITLSFSLYHGNPSMMSKKGYNVEGLLTRYSGAWVMTKCVHRFGTRYTASVELSR